MPWTRGSLLAQSRMNLIEQCLGRRALELAGVPSDAKTLAAELGNDVKMHVVDRLMSFSAVVLENVVRGRACRFRHRPAQSWQHASQRGCGILAQLMQMGF